MGITCSYGKPRMRRHGGGHQASVAQVVVMQEIARPERFAVLEREVLTRLTANISDDLIAPPDRRLNQELDEVPTTSGPQLDTRANFYIIAHVDLAASDLSRVQKALYRLADSARRTDGNLGFESLQEIDHPNHLNLVSAWLGEAPISFVCGKHRSARVPAGHRTATGLSVRREAASK